MALTLGYTSEIGHPRLAERSFDEVDSSLVLCDQRPAVLPVNCCGSHQGGFDQDRQCSLFFEPKHRSRRRS